MNFFNSIDQMKVTGDWVICIKQDQPVKMTVSVLFKADKCGDEASKIIPPLVFSDKTATEIDDNFFTDLNKIVPDTAKLLSSMEQYLKQREEAKNQSQMEKVKFEKEKKKESGKQSKYDSALKKVEELEKEGKFKEAWLKVPDPSEYPDHAEELRILKSSITEKFAPEIFANK